MQGAFTPKFEELRQSSPEKAKKFYHDLAGTLGLFLLLFTCASIVTIGLFLRWADPTESTSEVLYLTALLMPGLLFICLYGLNAALLQCERRYLLAGAAPSLLNIGWTIGVIALSSLDARTAMPWLAVFVVAAAALQWGATVPACRRIAGHFSWKNLNLRSDAVKSLLKPLLLGTIGVAGAQINSAADAIFARYADLEGPAYLWYAIRLQQLPLALFGIAIANAVLPPLSRAAKEGDSERFRLFSRTANNATLALMVPMTLGVFLFGDWAVRLIFQHGDFSLQAAQRTADCLRGYAVGLVPMALVICSVQGYYAQGNYTLPMQASLISVGSNFVLTSFFVFGLGWGAYSIALATSLSAWINLLMLYRGELKIWDFGFEKA